MLAGAQYLDGGGGVVGCSHIVVFDIDCIHTEVFRAQEGLPCSLECHLWQNEGQQFNQCTALSYRRS